MNDKLEAKITEAFPSMFKNMYGSPQETCMAFGIECGDGWFDLIYKLCEAIQQELQNNGNPPFTVDQVKEKFGSLRFYYSGYNNEAISSFIKIAEDISAVTCEQCGKPGKPTTKGWIKIRCSECQ